MVQFNVALWRLAVRDFFERNMSNHLNSSFLTRGGSALPNMRKPFRSLPSSSAASIVLAASVSVELRAERFLELEIGSQSLRGFAETSRSESRSVLLADIRAISAKTRAFLRVTNVGFQTEDPLVLQALIRLQHLCALLENPVMFFEGWRLQLHMYLETSSLTLCAPAEFFAAELRGMGGCVGESFRVVTDLLVRHIFWASKACEAAGIAALILKSQDVLHIFPNDTFLLNSLKQSLANPRYLQSAVCALHDASLGIVDTGGTRAEGSVLEGKKPSGWPLKALRNRLAHDHQLWRQQGQQQSWDESQSSINGSIMLFRDEELLSSPADFKGAKQLSFNLASAERRVFSQNGEDGVIEAVFLLIGAANRFYVEFGSEDGREGQARYFRTRHGFRGRLFDDRYESNPQIDLQQRRVNLHMVGQTAADADIPSNLDLLSIDMNGDEHLVWEKLIPAVWQPRVLCLEHIWTSIKELQLVAATKNYSVVYLNPINAIFVHGPVLNALKHKRGVEFLHTDDVEALCSQKQSMSNLGYGRPGQPSCSKQLGWR